jgi:WD40 repeat protein
VAYAIAYATGIKLVGRAGDSMRELATQRVVRSLSACGPWLAAATMDGCIELWDLERTAMASAASATGRAHHSLMPRSSSDGLGIAWRADGGGLALSGKRTAIYDFTGANPAHPYRKGGAPGRPGQPDTIPRIGMADGAERVAWAPHQTEGSTCATVSEQGVLRLWRQNGPPLKKGANGDPSNAFTLSPQFYIWPTHDALHPSGESAKPCALVWLRDDTVAVGYFSGDIVAWHWEQLDVVH